MSTTQRAGEQLLEGMVQLVQGTYSETNAEKMKAGDGRGLARLELALHQKRVPRQIRQFRVLVAAMSTIALVAGGAAMYRHFDKLTYEVVNGSIGAGGFVHPTATGTTIVFSEGSEIALGESARTRVDSLTANGGRVIVESGSVHARIVHRKQTRWFVEAGPYTIRVTGTAFKVKWSWTDEMLDLRMDRGSVVVTGPLAPTGVTLTAGMRLTANPRTGLAIGGGGVARDGSGSRGSAAISPVGTSTSAAGSLDEAFNGEPAEAAPGQDTASRGAAAAATGPALAAGSATNVIGQQKTIPGQTTHRGPDRRLANSGANSVGGTGRSAQSAQPWTQSWERLLARGNIDGILADAEARGVDNVLGSVSARELSALADAARYGHRPALARRTLLSMRDRFAHSSDARDAAFFLGGLAEDSVGSGGQTAALEWYDRYLGESAHGRYAAQALGRKMVLTQKLMGIDAALPVADDYLQRFPGGPYASAARKLIRAP